MSVLRNGDARRNSRNASRPDRARRFGHLTVIDGDTALLSNSKSLGSIGLGFALPSNWNMNLAQDERWRRSTRFTPPTSVAEVY